MIWKVRNYDGTYEVPADHINFQAMGDHVVATLLDSDDNPVAVFVDPESAVGI